MEYNFDRIKKDLENMRGYKKVLNSRKGKFSFPRNIPVLAYTFLRDGDFKRYFKIKKTIENNTSYLKDKYSNFRKIYSKRFNDHDLQDLLEIKKNKLYRLMILENRKNNLLSLKDNSYNLVKKKKLNNLIEDLNDNIGRKDRNINDLVYEIENERGLSLEIIYTQKLSEELDKKFSSSYKD